MLDLLKGVKLVKKDGTEVEADEALKDKYLGLYFSAHWCPPCRRFTPILKDFYKELIEQGKEFEIVFVSADESVEQMKEYLNEAHGDWLSVPFSNDELRDKLNEKFKVEGIPSLIILKPDGSVITVEGRYDVHDKQPRQAFAAWKEA